MLGIAVELVFTGAPSGALFSFWIRFHLRRVALRTVRLPPVYVYIKDAAGMVLRFPTVACRTKKHIRELKIAVER
jgi:hypothetical protein